MFPAKQHRRQHRQAPWMTLARVALGVAVSGFIRSRSDLSETLVRRPRPNLALFMDSRNSRARAMRVETHQPYRNITVRHRPLGTPKTPHYGRGRLGGPFELRKSAQMREGAHYGFIRVRLAVIGPCVRLQFVDTGCNGAVRLAVLLPWCHPLTSP